MARACVTRTCACLPACPACSAQGAWTQLHAACLDGNLAAVKVLLDAGLPKDAKDEEVRPARVAERGLGAVMQNERPSKVIMHAAGWAAGERVLCVRGGREVSLAAGSVG